MKTKASVIETVVSSGNVNSGNAAEIAGVSGGFAIVVLRPLWECRFSSMRLTPVANSIVEEELGLPATVPFDEVQYHDDTLSESAAERLAGRALEADPFESWFWRPSFYVGGDFDSLRVAGLAVQLQQPGGLGIAAEASHWRESWPGGTDHLWLGDANLLFEAVATERFRFRLGAGLNWLQDSWGGDSGMNLTAAADYRITPGWIVSGEADFGNLGASDLLHWKLLSSLAIRRAELYLGYDRYQIGTASLGAVISGVRWSF